MDEQPSFERQVDAYRRELTAYCYRMLGSAFEAEDAVQETTIRAWRSREKFEGRSSLRTWLYRIATNVCLDHAAGRKSRARPMDLFGPSSLATAKLDTLPEATWVGPIPDGRVVADTGDPAELAAQRESVKLAYVTALQRLAPKQRAVLVLREVLDWKAAEVAELLDTTTASVNSALQRARATLAAQHPEATDTYRALDEDQQSLLTRFMAAFERYDMDALAKLMHEDAVMSMPPFALWLRGTADICGFMEHGPGAACRGSRLVPVVANGSFAFGHYKPDPEKGGLSPWSLQVHEVEGGIITGMNFFIDTDRLFPIFGLPDHLSAEAGS